MAESKTQRGRMNTSSASYFIYRNLDDYPNYGGD
jgi:hypothetical protein